MSRFLVGLTGGLASGKSTVGRRLREAGFLVADADRLVAELYRPGEPGATAVAKLFGPTTLTAEGAVDHQAVAARIFADPTARQRLEAVIHPMVRQRFTALAAEAKGVAVLEAPLLVEAGLADDFDLVITIEAEMETRLARAIDRGLDETAARARLAAQGDGAARRQRADRILTNDGSRSDLHRAVDSLITELRAKVT